MPNRRLCCLIAFCPTFAASLASRSPTSVLPINIPPVTAPSLGGPGGPTIAPEEGYGRLEDRRVAALPQLVAEEYNEAQRFYNMRLDAEAKLKEEQTKTLVVEQTMQTRIEQLHREADLASLEQRLRAAEDARVMVASEKALQQAKAAANVVQAMKEQVNATERAAQASLQRAVDAAIIGIKDATTSDREQQTEVMSQALEASIKKTKAEDEYVRNSDDAELARTAYEDARMSATKARAKAAVAKQTLASLEQSAEEAADRAKALAEEREEAESKATQAAAAASKASRVAGEEETSAENTMGKAWQPVNATIQQVLSVWSKVNEAAAAADDNPMAFVRGVRLGLGDKEAESGLVLPPVPASVLPPVPASDPSTS